MTANSKQQTAKTVSSGASDPFGAAYTFRRLTVWERAQELASTTFRLAKTLPADRATSVVVQQVLRSATSVGANIAEGHGRFAAGACRNHLSIARGSTAETISWVDLMSRTGLISPEQESHLLGLCAEVMKMLTAKMIELDRQTRTDRSFDRSTRVSPGNSER
jgi:four helix bundle protein